MAKYANLTDITDSTVNVLEEDLIEADNYIDNLLLIKGINPADITLPNDTLKILAVYYATYKACVRSSEFEDSVFIEKAKQYEKLYKDKEKQIDPKTLGVSTTSYSIGSMTFQRG